ncbi:thioredoxin 3, putative [Plasmodium berghei]|uniref:Thioredoxin 3, putative n=2 Tax=Plasmodium berghei TaxID=5821 RepID=A0A509AGX3_PLABA|nr:thioredoxin 3, putative [Plasmodium berghei ANKA]CXI32530.1 thioredoxin 3, putative [Plasmodium berghei]SCM21145.1 thioredoxin 3, putative [Plasmodium berghei]SCN24488.1 thioredoxin 3, putative [Plasmodium berghei]SCO59670.1 thioredoxin 3, putative [Plasmodium berghei]SCO60857.1 thioredoxin 3, putative [Plasmodium berghei]|eukprot:XP_034421143.1 thioredoxin 3, putative [Plasmodium berghei ANKA]
MALICIGSVCFSLFHVGILILVIINFFYSHIKKILPQCFNPNNDQINQIQNVLQLKKKNREYGKSTFIKLSKNSNIKDIFQSSKCMSIVLKFGATWCKPCVNIEDYFRNQTNYYVVTLVSIDVDIHKALKKEHNINGLPTFEFYFFLNNEWILAERIEGANEKELEKAFQAYSLPILD